MKTAHITLYSVSSIYLYDMHFYQRNAAINYAVLYKRPTARSFVIFPKIKIFICTMDLVARKSV